MLILFLDFDGVLNSANFFGYRDHGSRRKSRRELGAAKAHSDLTARFDPKAVELLNETLDATGALVVVSASVRIARSLDEIQEALEAVRFRHRLFDRTPKGSEMPADYPPPGVKYERGHEIEMWLRVHPDVSKYVILDDSNDMAHHGHRLVRTGWKDGLTDELSKKAIEMLTT